MSIEFAANVLAGIIFVLAAYMIHRRIKTGKWSNPFK